LQYNTLTGSIPESIGDLSNLKRLYLRNNNLSGNIPSIFGTLLNLLRLKLQENFLTGQIPENICTLENLRIYLDKNQLCPPYPDCLSDDDIGVQDTTGCLD
jgi:Leucine-rich repeat (LRR) protein